MTSAAQHFAGPLPPTTDSVAAAVVDGLRRAPVLPAALALTAGVLLDRGAAVPLAASLITCAASLAAWAACRFGRTTGLARVYLALAIAAFGAGYHHWRRDVYRPDDISRLASAEPRPARLRGVLDEEPVVFRHAAADPLQSIPPGDTTRTVIRVQHLLRRDDWLPVSGRAQMMIEGRLQGLRVGDEVEVVGWLALPEPAANPGGFDRAAALRDQGIRAVVTVERTAEAVRLRAEGWRSSPRGWLAAIRGWGQRVLLNELH